MKAQHLVIVGAGIVGLSTALHARRQGYDVTIIDPDDAHARASYGNAGVVAVCEVLPVATPGMLKEVPGMLLSPSSPLSIRWPYLPRIAPWMVRFLKSSSAGNVDKSSRALASILGKASQAHQELASLCGLDAMLFRTGWLKAYETEKAFRNAAAERAMVARLGVEARNLSRDEIDALVPGAPGLFRHATMYPACQQIRTPGKYVEGMAAACRQSGVGFVAGHARSLQFRDGLVSGVHTEDGTVHGDQFVIAAGAWSRALAGQAGADVPLDTERGYHVMVDHAGSALFEAPILWGEKSIVMSQFADAVRITSSVEFAGLQAPPRYRKIERLLQEVRTAIPKLSGTLSSKWLGFRPSMPDSLPVIGRSPTARNCHFAFGHGHLGLTLGPVTGKLVVQALGDARPDIDLAPFAPTRFENR